MVRPINLLDAIFLSFVLATGSLFAQPGPTGTATTQPGPGQAESSSTAASPPSASGSKATSPPSAPSAQVAGPQASDAKNGTSKDRLFWTLPNFLTVENAHQIPPLTAKEKFKVVLRSAFDPVEYPYIGFLAGISQAQDSEPGFGQGAAGYGKRYGSAFADNTIENFMTGAILPSLLEQDPRYYQLGQGTFQHRLGYAISRMLVTRGDGGTHQFNTSEVLGSAIAAAISNAYHPVGDRTIGNTVSVWWTQIGWDTVAVGVKEFWPDIRRKVEKRHHMRTAYGGNDPTNSATQ
ncbi:MAG: hypothetical protein JO266_18420 [Acidobacteria bacterium]|nr:hypothetical protein [Acidobacteriota bacterium]